LLFLLYCLEKTGSDRKLPFFQFAFFYQIHQMASHRVLKYLDAKAVRAGVLALLDMLLSQALLLMLIFFCSIA